MCSRPSHGHPGLLPGRRAIYRTFMYPPVGYMAPGEIALQNKTKQNKKPAVCGCGSPRCVVIEVAIQKAEPGGPNVLRARACIVHACVAMRRQPTAVFVPNHFARSRFSPLVSWNAVPQAPQALWSRTV